MHRDVAFVETGDELATHLRRDEQAKQDQRRRAGHDETAGASRAPRLIRFALIFPPTIPVIVMSMESGMIAAVIKAARTFPRSKKSTRTTRTAPSKRFVFTVRIVASTRFVRS